jgi:hypothetical protein
MAIFWTHQSKMNLGVPYKIQGLYDGDDTIFNLSFYDLCHVGRFKSFRTTYYFHLQGNRTKQLIPSVLATCRTAQYNTVGRVAQSV